MKTFRVTLVVRCDTCQVETVIERKTSVECMDARREYGWTQHYQAGAPDRDECVHCKRKRDEYMENEMCRLTGKAPF